MLVVLEIEVQLSVMRGGEACTVAASCTEARCELVCAEAPSTMNSTRTEASMRCMAAMLDGHEHRRCP